MCLLATSLSVEQLHKQSALPPRAVTRNAIVSACALRSCREIALLLLAGTRFAPRRLCVKSESAFCEREARDSAALCQRRHEVVQPGGAPMKRLSERSMRVSVTFGSRQSAGWTTRLGVSSVKWSPSVVTRWLLDTTSRSTSSHRASRFSLQWLTIAAADGRS